MQVLEQPDSTEVLTTDDHNSNRNDEIPNSNDSPQELISTTSDPLTTATPTINNNNSSNNVNNNNPTSNSLDLESIASGISSVSHDDGSNSFHYKKQSPHTASRPKLFGGTSSQYQQQQQHQHQQQQPTKKPYSFLPRTTRAIMDTVAHSRKHAAARTNLTVPAGSETTASRSQGRNTSTTPTLTLSAWQYWSRLTDIRQMDLQSALDQMKTLLTIRPQVVYKTSYYRKQTKNHWARDDPAFLFLQGIFLMVAAVAYSVAFRVTLTGSISFLLYTVVWNWLGMGLALATLCREIANRHLQQAGAVHSHTTHVRQQVEWLYAFDIHCNSFFPVFVVLYGVQFFLLPLVLGEGWLPLVLANSLYAAALSWYWYITHLGYRSLPFLGNTEVFLFPIAAILLVFVISLIGYPFGFGWNAARVMARFYFM